MGRHLLEQAIGVLVLAAALTVLAYAYTALYPAVHALLGY